MRNLVKRLTTNESGASATEYAILLSVVGAAVFAAFGFFSTAFSTMVGKLITDMGNWVT
jgi:Flp pilus assembly pilin Flp